MEINICLWIVIIIVSLILLYYNKLIRLSNHVKQTESGIDIVLNQRFDLIPNIVECVKGYSEYESQTFENVVLARNSYRDSKKLDLSQAEAVNREFNKILALAENYPELKSNAQYLNLQNQLNIIENKLQIKRDEYNNAVTKYNTTIETIPSNIVARMFNFESAELFKLDENKRKDIKIDV